MHDRHAATIMPILRRRIPILIVAPFQSRLPRYRPAFRAALRWYLWLPLYRWLGGPSSEALESTLVGAAALPAIGYRWVGRAKT